jgi:hypothetical protein
MAGKCHNVTRPDRFAARRADHHRFGHRAARLVDDLQWRTLWRGVSVAPLAHRGEHGPEVATLVGETVVVPRRVLGVGNANQNPGVDERREPLVKDVPRDAEAALEVVEAGHAEECVPDDEHAPPFADDLEALCDRAVHPREALAIHGLRIVSCIIERNSVESAG